MADDDPLFNMDDYVAPGGGLPAHLKGKTSEEVAEYYSAQLRLTSEKVNDRVQNPPLKKEQQPPTNQPLTEKDVAPAMGTMIASAKMVAKASLDVEGQTLFARFLKDIETVMSAGFRGVQLADAQNWIFAYNQVVGSKAQLLMKESREAEVTRRTAETSSSQAPEEEAIELTAVQSSIGELLGIGAEGYKKGIQHLRRDEWPLTFDNRR